MADEGAACITDLGRNSAENKIGGIRLAEKRRENRPGKVHRRRGNVLNLCGEC